MTGTLCGRPPLEGRALRARAVVLFIALVLAAAPLSQLLAGPSWLVLSVVGAAPVILGGVALRAVIRRQMLVPLAQLALAVVVILAVEATLGVLDLSGGPLGVLRGQRDVVVRGAEELATGLAPLTPGPHAVVVMVGLIALVALLLDLMFLDLGWHTPPGLLLMGAVLLPALQRPGGGPWWQVAAPVLAGGMILAVRTLHADARFLRGDRRPQAGPVPRPLLTAAATATCLALVAGAAPLLGDALPRIAPERLAVDLQSLRGAGTGDVGPVMIDDDVSVRRTLLDQDGTEVLRFRTTAEEPSYLRLRTLNRFDGEAFSADGGVDGVAGGDEAFSDATDSGRPHRPGARLDRTDITIADLGGDRLPVPEHVRSVRSPDPAVDQAMRVRPGPGEVSVTYVPTGFAGASYTVETEPADATAEELRAVDPSVFRQPFDAGYTVEGDVPPSADRLAEQLEEESGARTAYDTALAYQQYFRAEFDYSLTVTTGPGEDPLESFLAERIGYCEQFAATFALMMTAQGYPSRVVIGFTPGEQDGEEWTVTTKNAHAWPEVWFGPEYGWVRFEPTPAAAANGVRPPTTSPAQETSGETPVPERTSAPADSPEPTPPGESSATETEEAPADAPTGAAASDGGATTATAGRVGIGALTAAAIALLLAGGAAAAGLLLHRRRLRARDARWARIGAREGTPADAAEGIDGADAVDSADGADGVDSADGADGVDSADGVAVVDDADGRGSERARREAGELAWSELETELARRERRIALLGVTGAWGRPPLRLALDPALPPDHALDDLLDRIDAGRAEVTAAHREAASRIAAACTAARYAAPLPAPGEGAQGDDVPADGPRPQRADADLLLTLVRAAR